MTCCFIAGMFYGAHRGVSDGGSARDASNAQSDFIGGSLNAGLRNARCPAVKTNRNPRIHLPNIRGIHDPTG